MGREIRTVRDYLESDSEEEFYFKSNDFVNQYCSTIYLIIKKPPKHELGTYLQIKPINGKPSKSDAVHILLRQHLDDIIFTE